MHHHNPAYTISATSRAILAAVLTLAIAGSAMAGTLDFATRVSCELQTASGTSLQRITWQQGTTPLLSVEQFRLGKAIAADTNTDAVVVIGPSATSQYYVAVTNQSTSGNSYLVQMPTIGTNTAYGVWWYTVYFQRDGRRYWTGNGALTIEATTSTGDGLVWQTITGVSVAGLRSALDAETLARASGDLVAMTNWQAVVYSLTNGAALGATALQPAATNTLAAAAAHAGTEHSVTAGGGFQSGFGASATTGGAVGSGASASLGGAVGAGAYAASGGAVGSSAYAASGGAVGAGAYAASGGAVGYGAYAASGGAVGYGALATDGGAVGAGANANYGGAVGYGALATDGGAVGYGASASRGGAVGNNAAVTDGGAVGSSAYAASGGAVGDSANANYGGAAGAGAIATDGGAVGYGALATDGGAVGANAKTSDGFAGGKDAFATSDGTFSGEPIDAIQLGSGGNSTPLTLQIYGNRLLNADGTIPVERMSLHNTNGTAHPDIRALIPALPGPGCTELDYEADGTTVTITGATYSYFFAPDKAYTLSVAPDAPRYHYSIEIIGDHACTLPAGHRLRGAWTITGTNEVVVAPGTGTVWNVFGRGL